MVCLSLRSAVLVGLLLGASAAPSLAASVQQQGVADSVSNLSTYGMQVASARALHDVLPKGWTLTIDPDVELQGRVSWGPKDNWLAVLHRVAERSGRDLIVNWESLEVRVPSIAEPALVSTPPTATQPVAAVLATASEKPTLAAFQPVLPVPSENTLPPVVPVAVATTVAGAEVAPTEKSKASNSKIAPVVSAAGPAQSFNRRPVREVFEAIAEYHGLDLIYEAGDIVMPGALTVLMDRRLENDMELIHLALGPSVRLQITHFDKEAQLVVSQGDVFSFASYDARPVEPVKRSFFARVFGTHPKSDNAAKQDDAASKEALAVLASNVSPTEMPVSASAPVPSLASSDIAISQTEVPASSSQVNPAETVVVVAQPPLVVLDIAEGELLSVALDRLLKQQGWILVWRANIDLQAATPARVSGGSMAEVLQQVLPQLDLTADLYNPSRTAVIRTLQATASQGAP